MKRITKAEFLAGLPEEGLWVGHIGSEPVHRGRILDFRREKMRFPDGSEQYWDCVHHNGAVCVIPVDDDGNVIFVRQYRLACDRIMTEIPAGKLEAGEADREAAARRELREETGAVAARMLSLGDFYPAPAYGTERITMYYADGLTFGATAPDDDEFLSTFCMPLADAVALVMEGKIEDIKTQAAVLRAYLLRQREGL